MRYSMVYVGRRMDYYGNVEKLSGNAYGNIWFYYLSNDVLYVKKQGVQDSVYHICRDNLGSVMKIVASDGRIAFHASYDAWGLQTKHVNSLKFYRGYTGHEMIPEVSLINMNGRMYDPKLGRFLSPDNYVQLPDNPQNLNRYSYCLNNPLKYTDPSGELLGLSFISGAIKGFVKIFNGKGNVFSPITEAFRNAYNDVKVTLGLFKGTPKQILSRFSWELPQTYLGLNYSYFRLATEDIDKVEYFDGATYVISEKENAKGTKGVTLGSYINITTNDPIPMEGKTFAPYKHPVYAHEYGHYLQSQSSGLFYLGKYGIPSLIDYTRNSKERTTYHRIENVSKHHIFWAEIDADSRAAQYYIKHGYLDEWSYENNYPTY